MNVNILQCVAPRVLCHAGDCDGHGLVFGAQGDKGGCTLVPLPTLSDDGAIVPYFCVSRIV